MRSIPTTSFLSTLSLRRATVQRGPRPHQRRFLSTLSLRRATTIFAVRPYDAPIFLSTLSLRRATTVAGSCRNGVIDFYPRSPCGERHSAPVPRGPDAHISIHALLAESDVKRICFNAEILEFLSTLSLRRATSRIIMSVLGLEFLSTLSLRRATVSVQLGPRPH